MRRTTNNQSAFFLLLTALLIGCDEQPVGPGEPPPTETTVDGLTFRAGVAPSADVAKAVDVTITATNEGAARVQVMALGGPCAVRIKVFRAADRSSAPIYDDVAGPQAQPCPDIGHLFDLGPGESDQLTRTYEGSELLRETFPPGPYFVNAVGESESGAFDLDAGSVEIGI